MPNKVIEVSQLPLLETIGWLQSIIAPRPIAFVSTIDKSGNANLSPFSFFGLFSLNPPIVIFSVTRRVRDNSTKHTYQNVLEVPEVGIHICDHSMIQQVSLSSCDYPKDVDEFVKSGFNKEQAVYIKPPLVKEAKIKLECVVTETKPLGHEHGAGILVICAVKYIHIDESILSDNKAKLDTTKMPFISRLGDDIYGVVAPQNLLHIPKPNASLGIGFDQLPTSIKNSIVLTGNDLAQLANITKIPAPDSSFINVELTTILSMGHPTPKQKQIAIHHLAHRLLAIDNNIQTAWQVLLRSVD
ncbi:MAG: flavin reductase family protein [Phycisphaerales bacterium]|nr:flavin reductase family protein [Phycisphaerales bacterium]